MKIWLVLGTLLLGSCDFLYKANPDYCDSTHPCPDGQTCGADQTCIPAPTISSYSPAAVSPDGGTVVTLTVQNIIPGLVAVVGNMPLTTTYVGSSQLQFTMPATPGMCAARMAMVTLQTADGQPASSQQQQIPIKYTTISFMPIASPYAIDPNAVAIAAAPVYKSLYNDLLVLTSNPSAFLYLLKGSGNWSFGTVGSYPGPNIYQDFVVGDLNGDQGIDVVARSNSLFDVFEGQTGTMPYFSHKMTNNNFSSALAVVKTDNTAYRDILLVDQQDNNAELFSFTNFTYPSGPDYPIGSNPGSAIVINDFNGDQIQDAAIAVPIEGTVNMLLGNGQGAFSSATVAASFPGLTAPTVLASADMDGDGSQDLVLATAAASGGAVAVALNKGGKFTFNSIGTIGSQPKQLFLEDLDCDGQQDIIVFNAGSGHLDIYLNQGMGQFAAEQSVSMGGPVISLVMANLGTSVTKPDIALLRSTGSTVSAVIYANSSQ